MGLLLIFINGLLIREEGFPMPKVWVRIANLPTVYHKYTIFWAISTMLGAPNKIDMATARATEVGRMYLSVLDPDLIYRGFSFGIPLCESCISLWISS